MFKICSLILSLFFIFSCTKKTNTDEIVIGEVESLTGAQATFGIGSRNGLALAVSQLNSAGGIKGKKIRVVTLDDQSKPEEAATTITKLITQDKVIAIVGEATSSASLAMAPIAQANKIPMISPSATNPKVTQVGDYIFRVCFIDPFQGEVMAKFAKETLNAKKAAVLRDIKNDYSVGLADYFIKAFTQAGGEVLIDQSYSANDVDFKGQLTSIKTKNPDVIFVPGYYTEVGLIARQARELGIKVPLLGGDGWDSAKLTEIGGDALNGSFFSNYYSPDDQAPQVQKFVNEYKAMFHEIPDGMSVMGYEAGMVLADAMKRAASLSSKDIRDALAQTKNYPGVTGNITINENRDAVKPAVVLEVNAGKYTYKQTVAP